MEDEVKVAIIISTYNRKELLKRTLTSLFKSFDKYPHITGRNFLRGL